MTNIHLFDRWIDALRSGKYHQGHRRMRDIRDNYCCLGVLCDVSNAGKWKLHQTCDANYEYHIEGEPISVLNLPKPIIDSLERDLERKVRFGPEDVLWDEYLIVLNDVKRWPFEKIADWLEEHRI